MKTSIYKFTVICSDATTITGTTSAATKREAEAFCNGIACVYSGMGKSIYMQSVKKATE